MVKGEQGDLKDDMSEFAKGKRKHSPSIKSMNFFVQKDMFNLKIFA